MQKPPIPRELRRWIEQSVSPVVDVLDVSWPRADSKVWQVRTATGALYVKVARTLERFEREERAYRYAADVLGGDGAPRLVAADRRLLAIATAPLPGVLAKAADLGPGEEREIHRLAGSLLGRWQEHAVADDPAAERQRAVTSVLERTAELSVTLHRVRDLIDAACLEFAHEAREQLPKLAEDLPLKFRHGDFQPRNWQWDRETGSVALLDFEEARFGIAVEDFTWLFGVTWRSDPHLEAACLEGYGRAFTETERQALLLFTVMAAVQLVDAAVRAEDAEMLARGKFYFTRLTSTFHGG